MMPSGVSTPKLDLLRIQETWQFGDAAFNRFIDDADNKLVGVAHLQSPMHWTEWTETTTYYKDDVVRYPNLKSHQYARCLQDGISDVEANMPENNVTGSIFTDGTTRWEVCSLTQVDADNGTIRIWLGGGVYYHRGDAVRYGDALYRAKIDHESSVTFDLDENKWQEIYASIRFWKPNTYYYLDDTAIYDDIIYKCIRAHKSVSNFETVGSITGDEDDWEIIGGAGGAKDWETNKKYQYGQLVLVNGILYRCNTKHRSSNSFSSDIANWDLVDAQIHDWATLQYYVAGTLVAYNNIIYKCLTSHSSSANFETDISNWTLYHNHITVWDRNKSYYQGQIILYENRLYKCNTTHVSPDTVYDYYSGTRNATFLDDISNFDVIYASLAVWAKNTVYKIGDTILYNNEPFRCVKNHTSGNTNTSTIFDDITNSASTNCWERIRLNNSYITNWASDTLYDANQLVLYNGTLYRCNTLHTSTSTFDPTKWDLVYANIQEWVTATPYKLHSMVINNDRVYLCINAHTSTTFSADSANWAAVGSGDGAIVDWTPSTAYTQNTAVMYNGILYRCNTTHNGSATFDLDAANWDIVYSSISTWTTGIYYPVNMLVSYNNLVYKCVTAHTASADFNTDIANWILYNNSITSWAASTSYRTGQIVLYDGVIYKCNTNHVSVSPFDVTKWDLVYANIRLYANNTIYKIGSEVIYNGNLYRCIQTHTSNSDKLVEYGYYTHPTALEYDTGWSLPIEYVIDTGSIELIRRIKSDMNGLCSPSDLDVYVSDDNVTFTLVKSGITQAGDITILNYGRYIKFVINTLRDHQSVTPTYKHGSMYNVTIYKDNAYWERIGNLSTDIFNWQSNHEYALNEIVLYNNTLYRNTVEHISGSIFDATKWDIICANIPMWITGFYYKLNSTVINNGRLYVCTTAHTSTTFEYDKSNWFEIGATMGISDWVTNTSYSVDSVVLYNDNMYRCNTLHTSSSTFDLDDSKWDIIYASIKDWITSTYYKVGTVVIYNGLEYKCNTAHISSSAFNTDIDNWTLLNNTIVVWSASTAYKVGQIVLYDGVEYRCNTAHISTSTFDTTKFDLVYANIRNFADNTIYKTGSIVISDNNIYKCLQDHTSNSDSVKYHNTYTDTSEMFRTNYIFDADMPHEDIVDLGEIMDVEHIYIEQSGYWTGISNLDIAVSADGTNYTVVYNYTNPTANVGAYGSIPMEFYYSGQVRYIKLIMHHMNSMSHYGDPYLYFWYTNLKVGIANSYWELVSSGEIINIATKAQIDALFI